LLKITSGLYSGPFPRQSRKFFSLLEIVIGWLVPSTQKIPLAENRFLQAGNGAEIIKENPGGALQQGNTLLKSTNPIFCCHL
jgi:hypothetical protein